MAEPCFPSIEQVRNFGVDSESLSTFINGEAGQPNVNRKGVDIETVETWRERVIEIAQQAADMQTYLTKADADAAQPQPEGAVAQVTNDPDPDNNGYLVSDGSAWIWSGLQPVSEARQKAVESALEAKVDKNSDAETDPDVLVSITDAVGSRTWLEAAKSDGGVTPHARSHVRKAVGIDEYDDKDLLYAVTDSAGRPTSLAVTKETGDFAGFVYRRMHVALQDFEVVEPAPNELYPTAQGGAGAIQSADMHWRDGEFLPVLPDMTKWAVWGSSTAAGFHASLGSLAATYGAVLYEGGKGSERLDETCARLGSRKAVLKFPSDEIPSHTDPVIVGVNFRNTSNMGLRATQGYIKGVLGTLSLDPDRKTFYFTRSVAGAAVPLDAPEQFTPIDGTQQRASVCILNLGKNTLTVATSLDAAYWTIEETYRAIRYLSPLIKRVVVLGHFQNTNVALGGVPYQCVDIANTALKEKLGRSFIDINEYLCSPQVWTDSGITPTPDDLTAQANGVKPPSLSADSAHLNAAGYNVITDFLVKPLIDASLWYGA